MVYNGSGFGGHKKSRSKIYKIEKENTAKVLANIARYFSTEYIEVFATDIGEWEMEITNTEGEVYKYRGSLMKDFEVNGVDLSDMVREALGIDDLYVFDGNNKPDRVERITVDYHRITKTKPKQPISETTEYVTWDYTEKLILDRKSETLEHIQNIGSGCTVSRMFYGFGEILDPDIYGKVKRSKQDYMYCSVEFEEGYKTYYYISDDDTIEVGDYVVVPAGKDNHHAIVEVVEIEYFPEADVPLPLEKTKHIIRKCTKEDFEAADSQEDDEQRVFCPIANREIPVIDCIEIGDVANGFVCPDVLKTFDPPIEWNEEQKNQCCNCKYHV